MVQDCSYSLWPTCCESTLRDLLRGIHCAVKLNSIYRYRYCHSKEFQCNHRCWLHTVHRCPRTPHLVSALSEWRHDLRIVPRSWLCEWNPVWCRLHLHYCYERQLGLFALDLARAGYSLFYFEVDRLVVDIPHRDYGNVVVAFQLLPELCYTNCCMSR